MSLEHSNEYISKEFISKEKKFLYQTELYPIIKNWPNNLKESFNNIYGDFRNYKILPPNLSQFQVVDNKMLEDLECPTTPGLEDQVVFDVYNKLSDKPLITYRPKRENPHSMYTYPVTTNIGRNIYIPESYIKWRYEESKDSDIVSSQLTISTDIMHEWVHYIGRTKTISEQSIKNSIMDYGFELFSKRRSRDNIFNRFNRQQDIQKMIHDKIKNKYPVSEIEIRHQGGRMMFLDKNEEYIFGIGSGLDEALVQHFTTILVMDMARKNYAGNKSFERIMDSTRSWVADTNQSDRSIANVKLQTMISEMNLSKKKLLKLFINGAIPELVFNSSFRIMIK